MSRNYYSSSSTLLFTGCVSAGFGVLTILGRLHTYHVNPRMRQIDAVAHTDVGFGLFAAFLILDGLILIAFGLRRRSAERRTIEKVRGLSQGKGASPKEFLNSRNALTRNGDFTGIYIFHNKTKDMYYVGQSTRVVGRVMQHLAGHGNGDVYADYKYGDEFEINLVSLRESGYDSLDALERDAIKTYNAYAKGYNRTRGNRN